ncbi:MAG TPA: hypothetical protein VMB22_02505 [Verrucomicrobiae bacterium]|nr:hypothetical protein [Verrucomicrobiae bacterium]
MRKLCWIVFGLCLCGLLAARADTFSLADGTSISGDVVAAKDIGLTLRQADDTYTNLPWTLFSQDSLKQLAQDSKVAPFVAPFIEIPQLQPKYNLEVTRLDFPPRQSIFGALFSSPIGLIALLLIYAANLYAGFQVALARSRPKALVMGVAAVLPILGPVIFLAVPIHAVAEAQSTEEFAVEPVETPEAGQQDAPPAQQPHRFVVPGMQAKQGQQPPEQIHIVAGGFTGEPPPPPPGSNIEIFQRGQYTFNRRFFETKFSGFFGIVRTEADRGKTLLVKTPGQLLTVERISRITANDMHVEVVQGGERREIMVAYADIQQVQLKSK